MIVASDSLPGVKIAGEQDSWISFYGNCVGAIFGAFGGGIVSVLVAVYIVNEEKKDRVEEVRTEKRHQSFEKFSSLLYTMLKYHVNENTDSKMIQITHIEAKVNKLNLGLPHYMEQISKLYDTYNNYRALFIETEADLRAFLSFSSYLFCDEKMYKSVKNRINKYMKREAKLTSELDAIAFDDDKRVQALKKIDELSKLDGFFWKYVDSIVEKLADNISSAWNKSKP